MASTSALSIAAPVAQSKPSGGAFLKPLAVRPSRLVQKPAAGKFQFQVREKAVTAAAAALTASMIVPDVAEAAVSPSLKNFLLSIGAGGVVAVAIVAAVIAVSNFDPVKRA